MANSADMDRLLQGKEVWNSWASAEISSGRTPKVDFSEIDLGQLSFKELVFPGSAYFVGTTFSANISFVRATFRAFAHFERAVFVGKASFIEATFMETAEFENAIFRDEAEFGSVSVNSLSFFAGASFEGDTSFRSAHFRDPVDFGNANFRNQAKFDRSKFDTHVAFLNTTFAGPVTFCSADISSAKFVGTKFEAPVDFSDSRFGHVPDFRITSLKVPPNFHGIAIEFATDTDHRGFLQRVLRRALQREDSASFRRLRQLAGEVKDHERELMFFAQEMRAKRFYETTGFWPISLNAAYDWLSDYGRSIVRPLMWLAASTIFAWGIIAATIPSQGALTPMKLIAALVLAFSNATLLIGSDKWALREEAFTILCGLCKPSGPHFGLLGDLLAYAQSGFSLLLILLIGLALRNRFRIGGGG